MKNAIFCLFENWEGSYKQAFKQQLDLVCSAERLGFDEAWIAEHHMNNFSVVPSPLAVVNYLLGRTSRIKIGTAAVLLPYYHPVKLAEEIASTQLMADERFLFGIAKGSFPIYNKAFGGNPLENRNVMLEANALIQRLLLEDNVTFKGNYFECDDISIRPTLQKPIPTFIASHSDAAIKEAATCNYGIIGSLSAGEEDIREIFQKFSSYQSKFELSFRLARALNIGYDEEMVLDEARKAADIFLQSMMASKNTNPALAKLLTNSEYQEIRSKLFDKNKILQNAIVGTPQECIKKIKELKEEFKIEALLLKPAVTSYKRSYEVLKLYKEEVMPYV